MNIYSQIASIFYEEPMFIYEPDENDYFLHLPSEVIILIGKALSGQDLRALHNVNRQIQLITKELIDLEIIKKFEEIILGKTRINIDKLPKVPEERIQKLRESISSHLLKSPDAIKGRGMLVWNDIENFCSPDYQLATQILKNIHEDLNQPFLYHESNEFTQKCFFLAMDMLINNKMDVKSFKIDVRTHKKHFFDLNPVVLNGPILENVLKALQNQSINSISIKVFDWKLDDLIQVLEVIKSNERIKTVEIIESSSDNFLGHINGLNNSITKNLGTLFEIENLEWKRNVWSLNRF